jgi:hypothetical protein
LGTETKPHILGKFKRYWQAYQETWPQYDDAGRQTKPASEFPTPLLIVP